MYCSVRLYHTKQETTALPQPACDCACAGGSKWCPEDCLTPEVLWLKSAIQWMYRAGWYKTFLWFFMCHGRDIIYECLWGMVFHPIIGILMGMWIPMTMDWPFYNVANYPSFDHGPCMYRLITPQLMLGWKVDETMDSYAFAYPLLASKLVNNQTRCGRHLSMNLNLGIDWHNIDVMWWCLIGIGSPKTILRFNNQLQDGIEKKLWVYGNRYHWPKPENHSTNKTNTNCRIAGSVASNHDWLAIAVFTSKNDPIIRNPMALQGS